MGGYSVIALDNPKSGDNVGGALRAAGVFGAAMVVISGERKKNFIRHPTDTIKAYSYIPTLLVDEVFDALPYNCVPVAVDILEGATSLPKFAHPERAFYIFGGEDITLGKRITDRCAYKVVIPSRHCLNLAASINVVLYDRQVKEHDQGSAHPDGM